MCVCMVLVLLVVIYRLTKTGMDTEDAIAVAEWAHSEPGRTAQLDNIVNGNLDLSGRTLSAADRAGLVRGLASSTAVVSVE